LGKFQIFYQLIFSKKYPLERQYSMYLYSPLEFSGVPFSGNNRRLLSWTMRAGFLIDAQWRVDSSGSSWLSAITSLMRSGTGNAAIVLSHQLSTSLDRSPIRVFNYRSSYPVLGIFFPINRPSRCSISNLILSLFLDRWRVIMNDVNFAAVLKFKFSPFPDSRFVN